MSYEQVRTTTNSDTTPTPYLLTVKQAAARLQLGSNRVYELVKRDHDPLPSITLGRTIRIPVKGLEAWLERQTQG